MAKFAQIDVVAAMHRRGWLTAPEAWLFARLIAKWPRTGLGNCWPGGAEAIADLGVSRSIYYRTLAKGVAVGLCRLHPRQYANGKHGQASTLIQWCVPPGFAGPTDPGCVGPLDESKRKYPVRAVPSASDKKKQKTGRLLALES